MGRECDYVENYPERVGALGLYDGLHHLPMYGSRRLCSAILFNAVIVQPQPTKDEDFDTGTSQVCPRGE